METDEVQAAGRDEFVSLDEIRRRVRQYREPQFMIPARFTSATFASFEIAPHHPEHVAIITRISTLIDSARQPRKFWQRRRDEGPRGIYLLGPPGVGKTHLLAAAYQEAREPKLFASFDELAAAAGTLGAHALGDQLAGQRLVCIDEITLDDPGNIMLLTTLMQRMLDGEPRIVASANFHPDQADNHPNSMSSFKRELGQIAGSFEMIPLRGRDRRLEMGRVQANSDRRGRTSTVLACAWTDLISLLDDTHPMHDAGWLEEIDRVEVTDRMTPFDDPDRALRFVRFIDRVYDRAVALRASGPAPTPATLLAPLEGDRRFTWHLARCRSRLSELLSSADEEYDAATAQAADGDD